MAHRIIAMIKIGIISTCHLAMKNTTPAFFPEVQQFIESLKPDLANLSPERTERLLQIAAYLQAQQAAGDASELVFICTHNSRRSHFGQVWAKVLADYYGISPVNTYSGGTEATAFNPNAIQALKTIGFEIEPEDSTPNPHYTIRYAAEAAPMEAWSKVYSDAVNPSQGFCAVMTCSEADEACPAVFGAKARVSLPFEDPKKSDGTPQEAETYLARCQQIATELAFVFHTLHA